uniref:Alkaline ceramidase n=1 Tax=Petromyzon marinus TaxID=7757 RepID=A0AAJ7UDT5_PETMA|nr:alkaline ceramidase 3-like isoform X2 [Petromyzon marinus]
MAPLGYWGPPTATLDWCEDNYDYSPFVAEFWNTLSNLPMVAAPLLSAPFCARAHMEWRYLVAHVGISVVGIGSWFFHMTLLYEMQLLDELPMIYTCCVFVYCLFLSFEKPNFMNVPFILTLVAFSCLVTGIYLLLKDPVFHQVMYGMLVCFLVVRGVYIAFWRVRVSMLPTSLGAVSQLHAWWHLLSGLGSYLHILFSLSARLLYLKKRPRVTWLLGFWPVLCVDGKIDA